MLACLAALELDGVADPPSPKGLTQKDFLEGWAIFIFIAEYNGEKHRVAFDRQAVLDAFPKSLPPGPHISPKNSRTR
jgi:hypothetical protein